RLARGALPLPEVLRHGAQIAEALDAAHRRGVVHRDLKPANVMLTRSGVKLLDFGLARLAAESAEAGADLPTMTMGAGRPLTEEGTVRGTYPYMAPEQVEGAEADARADIFALGAVLYEMATGKRAFDGKSAASVMAAVLRAEPEPLSKVQPVAPPALDHVVSRCLAKDPEERWKSAKDVAVGLRWIAEAGSQAGVAAPLARRRRSRERLAWGIAGALALAALGLGAAWLRQSQPEPLVTRSLITLPPDLTTGELTGWAISPDGRAVAMALFREGTRQLFVRLLDSLDTRALRGTESAREPFFSPDGEWIGYFQGDRLEKIPARGGAPLTIVRELRSCWIAGASWSEDGTIVFACNPEGLWRVSASGGVPEKVRVETQEDLVFFGPQLLPDRRVVLVTVRPLAMAGSHGREANEVVAVDIDTGALKPLVAGDWHAFLSPGYLMFQTPEDALMVAALDVDRLRLTGQPLAALGEERVHAYVVSRNGVLVYDAPGLDLGVAGELIWIGRDGEEAPVGIPPAIFDTLRIAPDGQRIAVGIEEDRGRPPEMHLVDLARGAVIPLPNPPGADVNPIWSPDGSLLAFTTWSGSNGSLFRLRLGAGSPELLLEDPERTLVAEDWSPDGRTLLLEVHPAAGGNADLFTLTMEGEPRLQRLLETPAHEETARFSPDGRFVAFTSDQSGRVEVYLAPYPEMDRRWQVSLTGGVHPRWAPDGGEILYREGQKILAASVSTEGAVSIGRPTTVAEGDFAGAWDTRGDAWDIAPDGRLLMVRMPDRREHDMVLVTNWHVEVADLLGTGKKR
ncbi:MAG TPA: protein kinase, partial [Thermoanaerobaculia bacterium]|nr:protein kinase [Thermoanaerobaculia bacterium]